MVLVKQTIRMEFWSWTVDPSKSNRDPVGGVKCMEITPDAKCHCNCLRFHLWYVVFYWYNVAVQGKIWEVKWLWHLIDIQTMLFIRVLE